MKLLNFLNDNAEKYLLVALLGLMASFIVIQVFMRYVMQDSLTWSEEFVRWIFVWFIWVGISYGFKVRRHVCIPMIVDLMPLKVKQMITLFADVIMALFFIMMFIYGMQQVLSPLVMRRTAITLTWPLTDIKVSSMWQYASMPIGALLSSIRLLQCSSQDFKALREATPEKKGVNHG